MIRLLTVSLALMMSAGCLVLTVNTSHDRDALLWEPALVGDWNDADDNTSLKIERGEWQSYAIEYAHPVEKGRLTGYLTAIGETKYLDVMPGRGEDRGSFVLPLHGLLRVRLEGDQLELTPLSYDWFFDRLKKKAPITGLTVVLDEKENALIVSPTSAVREWVRRQKPDALMFGAAATFTRVK